MKKKLFDAASSSSSASCSPPRGRDPESAIVALLGEIKTAVHAALGHGVCGATKHDLLEMERRLSAKLTTMATAIADFAAKQAAFNARQATAIDSAVASVAAVAADVKTLNDKIDALQASPGVVTPEDQALIDGLETQGDALATRTEGVASALAALDALTPPVPPPVA